MKHMSKGEETPSLPLKAPKVLRRMTNALMGQSKSAKVENVAAKTSSGNALHPWNTMNFELLYVFRCKYVTN